jgi:hypothetical protein
MYYSQFSAGQPSAPAEGTVTNRPLLPSRNLASPPPPPSSPSLLLKQSNLQPAIIPPPHAKSARSSSSPEDQARATEMSYAYLFKYIIIGDTGPCRPVGSLLSSVLRLDPRASQPESAAARWRSNLVRLPACPLATTVTSLAFLLLQASASRACCCSSPTSDSSPSTTSPSASSSGPG